MSEPAMTLTAEQVEETLRSIEMHDIGDCIKIHRSDLALLVFRVRQQAQADACEKAASHFEEMGPAHEMFCDSIADELRALAKPVGETT